MAMNTKKVLVGGIAAAVVLNVIDYVVNGVMLADRMKAEADAFKPGMSEAMMSGNAIAVYVITDVALGLLLVWTYAAVRPRFGPGAKTAVAVAVLFWILGCLFNVGYLMAGMMSMNLWWETLILWLINLVIASIVGAWLYTEEGAPSTA